MNSVSRKSIMSVVSKLLILIIAAKFITLSVLYFLASSGVNKNVHISYAPEYHRYDFSSLLSIEKIEKKKVEKVIKKVVTTNTSLENIPVIATLELKGIYSSKELSFVFISKKSKSNDVKMLKIGEVFESYRLIKIKENVAVFTLNGSEYVLRFDKVKTDKYVKKSSPTQKNVSSKKSIKREDAATVGRSEIQYYAKNFKQIWKDISIVPLKDKDKIVGFKVTRIQANTPFAKLGLQVNDIIIKANNMEMTSYRDALKIYEKIDDINAIEIVVLRNNEEMELVYEIY